MRRKSTYKNTSMTKILFSSILEALPDSVPFVAPEELERNRQQKFISRIGANESAFGISTKAEEAIKKAVGISGCSWYGDPLSYDIKTLLGEQLGLRREEICVDAGIDTLLGLTVRMLMNPGDVMVTSNGAYPTVNYHVRGVGGIVHGVPYSDNHEDPVALAEAAHEHRAKLVYLANPDNPMGTRISEQEIHTLIDNLPGNCVLMLDEAYFEFMPEAYAPKINTAMVNVIRFRTFSKAYGMAGMRIGYAFGNESLMKGYDKIRNHFGVNKLAQIAAAASLQDEIMLPTVRESVAVGRAKIYAMANELDLPYLESFTNFVAVDLASNERAIKMLSLLDEQGIFMRKPMQAPLDRYLRVGVGTAEEHDFLAFKFPELLQQL